MPTVLVVDDDVNIRRLVAMTLRLEGYTVREAEDGQHALESYCRVRPDVLVLDLRMPGLDGSAVFKRSDALGDRPPGVILSEVVSALLVPRASREKPFDPMKLSSVVEQLV